ncbi:MAG: hypothetical protein R2817_12600 [Flavobacteriales bacterium]
MSQQSSQYGISSLLTRRAKLYRGSELTQANGVFKRQFKFNKPGDLTNDPIDLEGTSVQISLGSIDNVEAALLGKHGAHARGIYFDYGISGMDFCPVVRFMFPDFTTKGDLKLFQERYKVVNSELVEITVSAANDLTALYQERIRIFPTDTTTHRAHANNGTYPDPQAEWFAYADNVNKLIADNVLQQAADTNLPPVKYLVVTCISEVLEYGAMALHGAVPEYRHMLALHTATENGDLLSTTTIPPSGSYAGLAMDLGHLCPPRCKKVL